MELCAQTKCGMSLPGNKVRSLSASSNRIYHCETRVFYRHICRKKQEQGSLESCLSLSYLSKLYTSSSGMLFGMLLSSEIQDLFLNEAKMTQIDRKEGLSPG